MIAASAPASAESLQPVLFSFVLVPLFALGRMYSERFFLPYYVPACYCKWYVIFATGM